MYIFVNFQVVVSIFCRGDLVYIFCPVYGVSDDVNYVLQFLKGAVQ